MTEDTGHLFTILILVPVSSVPGGHGGAATNHGAASPIVGRRLPPLGFATCPTGAHVLQARCPPRCAGPNPHGSLGIRCGHSSEESFTCKAESTEADVVPPRGRLHLAVRRPHF